ncbi:MAG TPA: hypothetical protein VFU48_08185, partial [Nitrospira sp.]|nr:hypothetical protein [Nitrospira sp.]
TVADGIAGPVGMKALPEFSPQWNCNQRGRLDNLLRDPLLWASALPPPILITSPNISTFDSDNIARIGASWRTHVQVHPP